MNRTVRGTAGMLAAIVLAILMAGGSLAQTGTPTAVDPSASPVASPEAAVSCAALMQLGSPEEACLLFINASPAAGNIDLYIDGLKAVDDLTFADVSGYFALPAGPHDLAVAPAGSTVDQALASADGVDLASGAAYELAVVGESGSLQLLVNPVDLAPLPPGTEGTPLKNTRVRAVHAVADGPAVDVTIISDDIAERIFSDVSYPTVTDYVTKTAGTYRIQVGVSGMDFASIDLGPTNFEGDTVYSMYAVGSVMTGDLKALTVFVDLETGASTRRSVPPVPVAELVQASSFAIYEGGCDQPSGRIAFDLTGSGYNGAGAGALAHWGGGGDVVGSLAAQPVEYGEGLLEEMNLGELLAERTSSIVVRDAATGEVVACGEIGGIIEKADNFWQHDRLIIGLRPAGDSGVSGIAILTEDTGILMDRIRFSVIVTLPAS